MGLDISYYSKIKRIGDADGETEYADGHTHIYVNPDFPAQADGLADGAYTYADGDGFRAGGYGGYNSWRQWLAKQAGYRDIDAFDGAVPADAPFLPLVNFSDCEGVIGAKTSKRLAADFAAFADKVTGDDYHLAKYQEWQRAFETASDGGAVVFH
jgi:hypothetical protein